MRLDEEMIPTIIEHARAMPSDLSTVDLWHLGGAIQRVGPEESAYGARQGAFLINPEANWKLPEDDAANVRWARGFVAAMAPYSDGSRYLNFAGFQEEGDEMMRKAFGAQYEKLAALKRQYDPENLFQLNQNVKPDGAVSR
jgi:hypothetical protein